MTLHSVGRAAAGTCSPVSVGGADTSESYTCFGNTNWLEFFRRRKYDNFLCKNELIMNVTSVKTGSLFLFKFVKGCCTGLRRSEMTMGDIT